MYESDKYSKSNDDVELQHIPNLNASVGSTGYNSYGSFDDEENDKIKFKTFQTNLRDVELSNDIEKGLNIPIVEPIYDTGPWNKRIKLLLKKIGERSMGYKWMHFQEFRHYEWINYFFAIFELVLLAILGGLTSGQFIGIVGDLGLKDNIAVISIMSGLQLLLLIVYGIAKGIREAGNYPQLIFEHKYNSTKYSKINLDIQHQFSLNIEDRDTDKEFLSNILAAYNGQLFESPKIRKSTMEKYAKETKEYKIYKPIDIGDFDTIEIVIENNTSNQNNTNNQHNTNNQNSNKINKVSSINARNDDKYNHEIDRWLQNF